jgi:putative phosphoribosyl transferase
MTLNDHFRLPFHDRTEAGRALANELLPYANRDDVVVLALPRGGVLVGVEIAACLQAPLAVLLVRKLLVPGHEEVPMGAVANGGLRFINRAVSNAFHVPEELIEYAIHLETLHLIQWERVYSQGSCIPNLQGKTVIIADDGVSSGSTMFLACHAVRKAGAREVIVAVPILPLPTKVRLAEVALRVISLVELEQFEPFDHWYEEYRQPLDREACRILTQFHAQQHAVPA